MRSNQPLSFWLTVFVCLFTASLITVFSVQHLLLVGIDLVLIGLLRWVSLREGWRSGMGHRP